MDKKSALHRINYSLQLAHEHDEISHTSYFPKEIKALDINATIQINKVKYVKSI
mgnify:CR=1 FL=1